MDVWSIAAINFNLPPNERYRSPNVLPLGFVPGPSEPSNLQSFLQPLVNELRQMPSSGYKMEFHDGSMKHVRVHLIYVSGDQPAVSKLSGLAGHCAARPCRDCNIEGVLQRVRGRGGHYYYPSRIRREKSGRIKKLYDIRRVPYRTALQTVQVIAELESGTVAEKTRIRRRTGIRSGSVIFQLHCADPSRLPAGDGPYSFFPHDVMHLFYNVQRELLHLWTTMADDAYFIPSGLLLELDRELSKWGQSISGQVGPKPRAISEFRRWKAADHKAFTLYYAPILLNGVLPLAYLVGVDLLSELADLSFRSAVKRSEIDLMWSISRKYVEHYEQKYYMFSPDRTNLCKSVIHILLHLVDSMKNYGPLIGVSQYWKEGFIGWINQRSNARNNIATSMFRFCLYSESVKAFYQLPFNLNEDEHVPITSPGGFVCLGPSRQLVVENLHDRGRHLQQLFTNYFIRKFGSDEAGHGVQLHEAKKMSQSISIVRKHSRVRFMSLNGVQTAHIHSRSTPARRDSQYLAVEMELTLDNEVDVYYGRLLDVMEFEINWFPEITNERIGKQYTVGMFDWAVDVEVERQSQVFVAGSVHDAFKQKSVEDLDVIKRLIGVVEHVSHSRTIDSSFSGRRTYIIDTMMRSHGLLDPSYTTVDGINRCLKLRNRSRRCR